MINQITIKIETHFLQKHKGKDSSNFKPSKRLMPPTFHMIKIAFLPNKIILSNPKMLTGPTISNTPQGSNTVEKFTMT